MVLQGALKVLSPQAITAGVFSTKLLTTHIPSPRPGISTPHGDTCRYARARRQKHTSTSPNPHHPWGGAGLAACPSRRTSESAGPCHGSEAQRTLLGRAAFSFAHPS